MTQSVEQRYVGSSDGQLLAGFLKSPEDGAFAEIVRRHGGMVLGVCRSVLRNESDADDAAQAVFLTLAQRASSLTGRATLVGWLYRVAWYIAAHGARSAETRRRHEREAALMKQEAISPADPIAMEVIHTELERLPERYRLPLLLHHLEGRTQEETAAILGCTVSAASVRLTRGREMLRKRLGKRGVAVSAVGVASAMASQAPASMPGTFMTTVDSAAVAVTAGKGTAASASITELSQGALKMLFWTKMKLTTMVAAGVMLVGGGGAAIYVAGASDTAPTPATVATRAATSAPSPSYADPQAAFTAFLKGLRNRDMAAVAKTLASSDAERTKWFCGVLPVWLAISDLSQASLEQFGKAQVTTSLLDLQPECLDARLDLIASARVDIKGDTATLQFDKAKERAAGLKAHVLSNVVGTHRRDVAEDGTIILAEVIGFRRIDGQWKLWINLPAVRPEEAREAEHNDALVTMWSELAREVKAGDFATLDDVMTALAARRGEILTPAIQPAETK